MAKKLYESDNIKAIADAIRKKTGNNDSYKVSDMPQAILDIPSGNSTLLSNLGNHTDKNGKWHKPEEWDDIESIDLDAETGDSIYILYDTKLTKNSFCSVRVYGEGTIKWSYGHVSNGVYTPITSETTIASGSYIRIYLQNIEDNYIVLKISSTTYLYSCVTGAWVANTYIASALPATNNTALMRYGKLTKGNNIQFQSYFIESDNIKDFAKFYQNTTTTITVSSAYNACYNLQRWRCDGWNLSKNKIISFASMFGTCLSLSDVPEELDMTEWVTSNCTSVASMFSECRSFNCKVFKVYNWDLTNVTNMSNLFYNCRNVVNILGTETWNAAPKCTTVQSLFNSCYKLNNKVDISNLHLGYGTAKFTNPNSIFASCYSLEEINCSNINLTNVTTIANMFYLTYSLKKLTWDNITPTTSICTSSATLFYQSALEEVIIDGYDFTNCASSACLYQCFYYSYAQKIILRNCKWTTINQADGTGSSGYFARYAYKLRYLDVRDIDMRVYTGTSMHISGFRALPSLVEFYPPQHICKSFYISESQNLDHDSIVRIIDNLDTVSGQTLTLGTHLLAKISAEEKQIAIDKGWTVV